MADFVDIIVGDGGEMRSLEAPRQPEPEISRENAATNQESNGPDFSRKIAEMLGGLSCCLAVLRKIPAAGRRLASVCLTPRGLSAAFGVCLVIFGVAVAAVGIAARIDTHAVDLLALPGIKQLSLFVTVMGFFTLILGAFGLSLMRRNRLLLVVFVVALGCLIICQFCTGIACLVKLGKLPSIIEGAWDKSSDDAKYKIQTDLECCGFRDEITLPCPPNFGVSPADKLRPGIDPAIPRGRKEAIGTRSVSANTGNWSLSSDPNNQTASLSASVASPGSAPNSSSADSSSIAMNSVIRENSSTSATVSSAETASESNSTDHTTTPSSESHVDNSTSSGLRSQSNENISDEHSSPLSSVGGSSLSVLESHGSDHDGSQSSYPHCEIPLEDAIGKNLADMGVCVLVAGILETILVIAALVLVQRMRPAKEANNPELGNPEFAPN